MMIPARTIAFLLVLAGAAVTGSAQNAAAPQLIDRTPFSSQQAVVSDDGNASLLQARAALSETPSAFLKASAAPTAMPKQHEFWDRQQKFALTVESSVRLADTIKTCRELADGGREDWIPTQSCAGVAAWNAGSVGVALGVSWLFHHYGRHRLERIVPWVSTAASAAGLTKSVFNIY
jgi:hypothetical protein